MNLVPIDKLVEDREREEAKAREVLREAIKALRPTPEDDEILNEAEQRRCLARAQDV